MSLVERNARGVSDKERVQKAPKGIEGKYLTYLRIDGRPETPSLG